LNNVIGCEEQDLIGGSGFLYRRLDLIPTGEEGQVGFADSSQLCCYAPGATL
jgi:hypothetical protein